MRQHACQTMQKLEVSSNSACEESRLLENSFKVVYTRLLKADCNKNVFTLDLPFSYLFDIIRSEVKPEISVN